MTIQTRAPSRPMPSDTDALVPLRLGLEGRRDGTTIDIGLFAITRLFSMRARFFLQQLSALAELGNEGGPVTDSCRIHVSERRDSANIFVTIWRTKRVASLAEWAASDEPSLKRRYVYERSFDLLKTSPAHVVQSIRSMLLSPYVGRRT